MSGLTVRSYVRMAFDQGSYQKTQQDYNAALAGLQNSGMGNLKKVNADIKREHDRLSKQLDQADAAAQTNFQQRTAEMAKNQQNNLKQTRAQRLQNLGDFRVTKAGNVYEADAKKYKNAVAVMRAANRAFISDMKGVGISVSQLSRGPDFDVAAFRQELPEDRATALGRLKNQMSSLTDPDRIAAAKIQFDQLNQAHLEQLQQEKQLGTVLGQNARIRRNIFRDMKMHIRENQQAYKEQLQLQMQLNATLRRGI